MKKKDLYLQLKEAFSDKNLNKITALLINLYNSKQYDKIKEISVMVSEYINIYDEKINKCFSRLIMLYHPDKGEFYRKEIDAVYLTGKIENFKQFSHILLKKEIENIALTNEIDEDIDYSPEYRWDGTDDGYDYFSESDDIYTGKNIQIKWILKMNIIMILMMRTKMKLKISKVNLPGNMREPFITP